MPLFRNIKLHRSQAGDPIVRKAVGAFLVNVLMSVCFLMTGVLGMRGERREVVYDIDRAKEICSELPLDNIEGVWEYPDDKVVVLILGEKGSGSENLMSYAISVVETTDARLRPGDVIGRLVATPDVSTYKIELATEKKNDLYLKPKSCIANLSKDGDVLLLKKHKQPFKGRLNLNFSRLLPGFWKMVSFGISPQKTDSDVKAPVGMVKIFPSYDGNGSSRRKARYL